MLHTGKHWFAKQHASPRKPRRGPAGPRRQLKLEILEDRCVPATGSVPSSSFVQSLYQGFLGRTGSASEVQWWVDLLPTLGETGVVQGITRSPAALTHAVDGFYVDLLGRQPVGGEDQGWVTALQGGATEEQVAAGILASPEFASRAESLIGADANTSYVRALYQLLLGRSAEAGEVTFWVNALPTLGRSGVAQAFLGSPEFRSDVVEQLYGFSTSPAGTLVNEVPDLLHRTAAPNPGEVSFWVASGLDLLRLEQAFADSPEYELSFFQATVTDTFATSFGSTKALVDVSPALVTPPGQPGVPIPAGATLIATSSSGQQILFSSMDTHIVPDQVSIPTVNNLYWMDLSQTNPTNPRLPLIRLVTHWAGHTNVATGLPSQGGQGLVGNGLVLTFEPNTASLSGDGQFVVFDSRINASVYDATVPERNDQPDYPGVPHEDLQDPPDQGTPDVFVWSAQAPDPANNITCVSLLNDAGKQAVLAAGIRTGPTDAPTTPDATQPMPVGVWPEDPQQQRRVNVPGQQLAEVQTETRNHGIADNGTRVLFSTEVLANHIDTANASIQDQPNTPDGFLVTGTNLVSARVLEQQLRAAGDARTVTLDVNRNAIGNSAQQSGTSLGLDPQEFEPQFLQLSGDGNWVVYSTRLTSANVVAGTTDSNFSLDVFTYDVARGQNVLVSRMASNPTAAAGSPMQPYTTNLDIEFFDSQNQAVSDNGQTIAFTSTAGNLVSGWVNNSVELLEQQLEFFYVFGSVTDATNTSPIVITTAQDHRLQDGDRVQISGVQGNTAANSSDPFSPSQTNPLWTVRNAQGRQFSLYFSDGRPSQGNGTYVANTGQWSAQVSRVVRQRGPLDIYAFSTGSSVTQLVNTPNGTANTNLLATFGGVSGDGSTLLFSTAANNFYTDVFPSPFWPTPPYPPFAAGNLPPGYLVGGFSNVWVRNINTQVTTIVSASADGRTSGNQASTVTPVDPATAASLDPLSDTGRFVLFSSTANNLATGVTDRAYKGGVFLRDLATGETTLISTTASGNFPSAGRFTGDAISGDDSQGTARVTLGGTGGVDMQARFRPEDSGPATAAHIYSIAYPQQTPPGAVVAVTGAEGRSPLVYEYRGNFQTAKGSALANGPFPGFTGEIRSAVGDVNGDGVADYVYGTGPGQTFGTALPSSLAVLDGRTNANISSFAPFAGWTGGVFVAAGDVNGDGYADLLAGQDGGSQVAVFSGRNGTPLYSFAVPGAGFAAGVRVAAGDVTGDRLADLVVGAGSGAAVLVIDPTRFSEGQFVSAAVVKDFRAFASSLPAGVYVAAGDLTGQGRAHLIVGAGAGLTGEFEVQVIDPNQLGPVGGQLPPPAAVLAAFDPLPTSFTGGVTVASRQGMILTGVGGKVLSWLYRGPSQEPQLLVNPVDPYGAGYQGRIYVG